MFRKLLRALFGLHETTDQSSSQQAEPKSSHSAATSDAAAALCRQDGVPDHVPLTGLDARHFAPAPTPRLLTPENQFDLQAAAAGFPPDPADDRWPDADTVAAALVYRGLTTHEELNAIREATRRQDTAAVSEAAVNDRPSQTPAEKQAAARGRREARRRSADLRHRTDITFLGRGVSRGLADRVSDRDRLRSAGLPELSTPAELADAVQLSISKLRWLAFHSEAATRSHYYTFQIPRKSGGLRTLAAPHRTLANVQGWILDEVLSRLPVHAAAHGFVPARSVVSNARPHTGARVVINVDLKDFFPAITFHRVNGLFRSLGYSPAVSTILALLCTEAPREPLRYDGTLYYAAIGPRALPQGACTSPAISNLIVKQLDRRLQGLARCLGWTYTRYADDITWSAEGEPRPSIGYVLSRIRHIVEDEGFRLNASKTRVLRPNRRQAVTGVTVNDRLNVPRKTIRRIRAILHNAQFTGLEAQNREGHPHFDAWLLGMIGWVRMVHPEAGQRLRDQFDALHAN